jgi:talin
MVKQAKILAQATAQLVSSLRQQAELAGDDTNQQNQLLSAAKMLADATAKMVESAKSCATKPNDTELQYQLKKAAEELRSATNIATSNSIKRKILRRVEQCAKHCASCATQCIAATSGSAMTNKNQQSHQQLVEQCKLVADLIPKVVQGIRGCMVKPDSSSSQVNLLNACEDFLGPATRLANLAKASVPTVHDQSQALHLNNSSKQLTQALIDLRACLTRAQELCGTTPLDIESIVESIEILDRELEEIRRQAKDGHLKAKPDETIDTSSAQLCSVCKQVNTIISQLLSAVAQNDEKTVETCTREILQILRKLTNSTRGIAATSNDHQVQDSIIERSHQVLERSTRLVREAKKAIHTPDDLEMQNKLAEIARDVSSALNACISSMPSQRYLDEAIKQMSEYIYTLAGPFDRTQLQSTTNFQDKQAEITRAAANLNQATTDLVLSTRIGTTQDLGKTSTRFTNAFGDFIDNGIQLANHQPEEEKRTRFITSLKNVHTSSNQFLEKVKSISIEPSPTTNETKQQLSNAARVVTDSINHVITVCVTSKSTSESSIGRLECDNAIREMETSKTFLQQSILQPCNNYTYYEALDQVVDSSKRLGEAMTHIASASKNTNHQLFTQAVQDASKAVCRLAESSAQVKTLAYYRQCHFYVHYFRQVILLEFQNHHQQKELQ